MGAMVSVSMNSKTKEKMGQLHSLWACYCCDPISGIVDLGPLLHVQHV